MKNLLFILVGVFVFCGSSFAQLNPSFESWTGTEPNPDPDNWYSNNAFIGPLGVNGPFVVQDMSASEGSFSVKLITKTCPNCPANGFPNPAPGFLDQVEPFSGMVMDSVKFDYQYIPAAASDTGYFQLQMTHWVAAGDSSSLDYYADYIINPSTDWATASSPLLSDPNNVSTPDSLSLSFFASLGGVAGLGTDTDGTELLVDNIRFVSMITGVEESLQDVLSIKVYPNPVVDYLTFEVDNPDVQNLVFFDVTGKMVHRELLSSGTTNVELPQGSAGTYFYIVTAKDGRQMKSGKISVAGK